LNGVCILIYNSSQIASLTRTIGLNIYDTSLSAFTPEFVPQFRNTATVSGDVLTSLEYGSVLADYQALAGWYFEL
jgi:hypothetical protein